jgi:hypothetical protein
VLTFQLVESDTVAPEFLSANFLPLTPVVQVNFSEPLDPEFINANTFQVFDPSEVLLAPTSINLRNAGRQVELAFAPLPTGDYRLAIAAEGVRDVAGNELGSELIEQRLSFEAPFVLDTSDADPTQPEIQVQETNRVAIAPKTISLARH